MGCAGHAARLGHEKCVKNISLGTPEGSRPLGRPMRIWELNVKLSLCLTKHHAMKAYWGSEDIVPRIL
jgi:hypothetical protein